MWGLRTIQALIMTAGFLLPPVMLSAADVKTAGEREIALWVLRKGGAVLPAGTEEYTRDPFDLPAGELHAGCAQKSCAGRCWHWMCSGRSDRESISCAPPCARQVTIQAPASDGRRAFVP